MAKKPHPTEETSNDDDKLYDASPELIAIESPDRDIKPSDVPVKEDPKAEHLEVGKPKNRFQRFFAWFWRKKWLTIPGLLLIILAVLLIVPFTRYGLTSWFWKEAIVISVTDITNRQAVSEATVVVAGQTAKTDKDGKAKFTAVPVGEQQVTITKKYYKDASLAVTVPWFAGGKTFEQSLQATGRLVNVTVLHKITGNVLANVAINVANEPQAHTDDKGIAHLVIPADKAELAVTLTADNFNSTQATIKQSGKNELQIAPTGRVYFLSKQSGKIDVVSTNLDGSDRKVLVEGTGNEENNQTNLLASRDWKYLVLRAKRETNKPAALYLIDTAKGSLELIDQGDVNMQLVGWSGHHFFYHLYRNNKKYEDSGYQVVKSYNAETRKLAVIDENQSVPAGTSATNYVQQFGNFYIVSDGVVYTKTWSGSIYWVDMQPTDKLAEIVRVGLDGTSRKTLKSYPSQSILSIEARLYAPQEIYFQLRNKDNKPLYAELEDGEYHEGVDGGKFETAYPTFLMSPNGNQSFWSESRDGKYTLVVGDKNANNKQEIASKSEYQAYGWFGDEYLLMQKSDSELYITTGKQLKAGAAPIKISDYHKPNGIVGYGYGYGGQ